MSAKREDSGVGDIGHCHMSNLTLVSYYHPHHPASGPSFLFSHVTYNSHRLLFFSFFFFYPGLFDCLFVRLFGYVFCMHLIMVYFVESSVQWMENRREKVEIFGGREGKYIVMYKTCELSLDSIVF